MGGSTTTILILSANPRDTGPLRLDEEHREIKSGLMERSRLRDQFRLITKVAVRPRDFQRAMLDHSPQVVHFSGHGSGEQGIALEDEGGNLKLVDAASLSALFELYKDTLQCVVLNACYSEVQAKAIVEHIPYAIGMSDEIGDRAAIEFAIAFYDALGAGRDIEFAYKNACVAIQMAGISQSATPTLHRKSQAFVFGGDVATTSSPENQDIFSDLETLLKNHQWKEADGETARLMIVLSGDQSETQFRINEIDDFPCAELLRIDALWQYYSQGKFGFTIQKNIWSRMGRDFKDFSNCVGWRVGERWLTKVELQYNLSAPQGHLPSLNWVHIQGWAIGKEGSGHSLYILFKKILDC